MQAEKIHRARDKIRAVILLITDWEVRATESASTGQLTENEFEIVGQKAQRELLDLRTKIREKDLEIEILKKTLETRSTK